MTKLCFQHLPMPQFTTLQKRVFPVYFSLQFGLVLLTTATYPPRSLVSLAQGQSWGDCVALGLNAAMAGLNMFVYGPRTQKVMVEKIHQGGHFEPLPSTFFAVPMAVLDLLPEWSLLNVLMLILHRNKRCTQSRSQSGRQSEWRASEPLAGDEATQTQLLEESCRSDSFECDCDDRDGLVWFLSCFEDQGYCVSGEALGSV